MFRVKTLGGFNLKTNVIASLECWISGSYITLIFLAKATHQILFLKDSVRHLYGHVDTHSKFPYAHQ